MADSAGKMDGGQSFRYTQFSPKTAVFIGFLFALVLLGAYTDVEVLTGKTKQSTAFRDVEVVRLAEKVAEMNSKIQQLADRQSRVEFGQTHDKAEAAADDEYDRSTSTSDSPGSSLLRGRSIVLRVKALEKKVDHLQKRLQVLVSGAAQAAGERTVPVDKREHEKKERVLALIREAAYSHPDGEVKTRHRRQVQSEPSEEGSPEGPQSPPGPPAPREDSSRPGNWYTDSKAL